jgi:hypothetical protein
VSQKVSTLAIDINVTGAEQAKRSMETVEKTGRQVTERMQKMAHANADYGIAALAAAAAVKKMLDAAEAYTRIGNRIALVTQSAAESADVQNKLFQLAQNTGTAFESVATQYSQIALAARDLGASQAEIIQVVANVSKSLQISGSSAAEAAGSSTQFVQSLSSGKLRAEELISQLEGN